MTVAGDSAPAATPPALPAGADYDLSIHSNPDAAAWARLFKETCDRLGKECDEGWMLGWFANAMMAMYDHLKRGAAPAPGTATREEFERLVGALAWAAYREANPYVPDGSAKTNAARAELLRYEERLRGQADLSEARYMRACEEAQRAEEATARVERLVAAVQDLATRCTHLAGEASTPQAYAVYVFVADTLRAALGVPTSAADGGAK